MAILSEPDLTIVYYTANVINASFYEQTKAQLELAAGDLPIVSVSMKPIELGVNTVIDTKRSHVNIYRQLLIGAKMADTKYIATAEDDVLYSPEHFKYRPSPGKFAYNTGTWMIFTWGEPMFSQKIGGRRNLTSLICEREALIKTLEERFAKYPDEEDVDLRIWAEPGKYEGHLGITQVESETFYTNPPNIIFSHDRSLSFGNLGTRKAVGQIRALEVPYWGRAEDIRSKYE